MGPMKIFVDSIGLRMLFVEAFVNVHALKFPMQVIEGARIEIAHDMPSLHKIIGDTVSSEKFAGEISLVDASRQLVLIADSKMANV